MNSVSHAPPLSGTMLYRCQACEHETRARSAYCRCCGTWNAYLAAGAITPDMRPHRKAQAADDDERFGREESRPSVPETVDDRPAGFKLREIETEEDTYLRTGIRQVDMVLGDDEEGNRGAVLGASYIVQGEPGIGKSTLLTQILAYQCRYGNVIYICGEEKIQRVKKRATRLQLTDDLIGDRFHLIQTNDTDHAIAYANEIIEGSDLPLIALAFDSFQVFRSSEASGPAGSEGQTSYIYDQLVVGLCQPKNVTSYLVSQETKDGDMRGSLSFAHMVDATTIFERMTEDKADKRRQFHSPKNRNSPPGFVAHLLMKREGLKAIMVKRPEGVAND